MTLNSKNMKSIKFLAILFASTVFAVLLHQIRHDPLMTVGTKAKSVVITSGYFPLAAFSSLIVAFGVIGLMFLAIHKTLYGTKYRKGALFGMALGGMYFVGMIEAYAAYPVPLLGEVFTGMVDGCGILFMSLLLGRYLADDSTDLEPPEPWRFSSILIISIAYVLIRYFSYTVIQIESGYSEKPLATFLWTAAMGCWIGVMYMSVGRHIYQESPFSQSLAFGGLIYGFNWLIFNLFVLLFIKASIADLFYRALLDTLAIVIGVYCFAKISKIRKSGKSNNKREVVQVSYPYQDKKEL